jgi:hypothetical protein
MKDIAFVVINERRALSACTDIYLTVHHAGACEGCARCQAKARPQRAACPCGQVRGVDLVRLVILWRCARMWKHGSLFLCPPLCVFVIVSERSAAFCDMHTDEWSAWHAWIRSMPMPLHIPQAFRKW